MEAPVRTRRRLFRYRRRWGLVLLLAVAGGALALLLDWKLFPWFDRPPPALADTLEDYLPEDTAGVLRLNLADARETPAGQKYLLPLVQAAARAQKQRFGWMDLLGVPIPDSVAWVQVSVGPDQLQEPLWLAGGSWVPARMQVGHDRLHSERENGFPLYTHVDTPFRVTTTIVPLGPTLVASVSRPRVLAALQQAIQPREVRLNDRDLDRLWQERERKQTVWLAARLSAFKLPDSRDAGPLRLLLPVVRRAETVAGSLSCGEDVQAELRFQAHDDEAAGTLEKDLQGICAIAGTLPMLFTIERHLTSLADLLATGKTSRTGRTVALQCRLPATE